MCASIHKNGKKRESKFLARPYKSLALEITSISLCAISHETDESITKTSFHDGPKVVYLGSRALKITLGTQSSVPHENDQKR